MSEHEVEEEYARGGAELDETAYTVVAEGNADPPGLGGW